MKNKKVLELFKTYMGKKVGKSKDLIVSNSINDKEYIIMEMEDFGKVWLLTLKNAKKVESVLEL